MSGDFSDLRENYRAGSLEESQACPDPFEQFGLWMRAALDRRDVVEPYAMTLATVARSGAPSARVVLLRGYDERGFTFFTNYDSRKGDDVAANPHVALVFWWGALQRQIRIEGTCAKIDAAESDAYFARRPRGHRLSAWASPQSSVVAGRADLEARMASVEARFPDDVPRPPRWGGYRVVPEAIEFWQGRENRIHDRLRYERAAATWTIVRLAP